MVVSVYVRKLRLDWFGVCLLHWWGWDGGVFKKKKKEWDGHAHAPLFSFHILNTYGRPQEQSLVSRTLVGALGRLLGAHEHLCVHFVFYDAK